MVVWIAVVLAVIATRTCSGAARARHPCASPAPVPQAFGVSAAAAKLMVFVYAAMLAGLPAGYAFSALGLAGSFRRRQHRISCWRLGGASQVYGAILGAVGITFLRDQLQNFRPG